MTDQAPPTGGPPVSPRSITYRCGWRYQRPSTAEQIYNPLANVKIQRGTFQARLGVRVFDEMPDNVFTEYMEDGYRRLMFQQIQADLDTFARQILGDHKLRGGFMITDVPYPELKAALNRYLATKEDTS